jgi:HEAT repeat protein
MIAMRSWPIAIAAACVALTMDARPSPAQGRVSNSRIDTRPAAQGLERDIRSVAATGGVKWIGYRAPMVAGHRRMCCFDTIADSDTLSGGMCRLEGGSGVSMSTGGDTIQRGGRVIALEPATEFLILARFEDGTVTRVRTFTPDCDIDAGGMPITWFTDVKPDESVAWLSSLVTSTAAAGGEPKDRVVKTALSAVALHNVPSADRALESFVASNRPEWLRGDTAFWLGSTRGDAGARLLQKMIAEDPSDSVRDKVTFGLSVSSTPSALTTLINTARNDQSRKVRGQALFWLAQKAGKEAMAAITGAIDNDPDTEVKKKAVFALSQLPKDEGVPKLIEIARSNRNPAVRKQAMFWLGQSNDPRAVKFFEDVLLKR